MQWQITNQTWRYLPLEWWPLAFDVIQHVTEMGLVVVEAAGNGDNVNNGIDLMDPDLEASRLVPPLLHNADNLVPQVGKPLGTPNPFDPQNPNSGAILVGAGASVLKGRTSEYPERARMPFSNYGVRVDVQGPGQNVVTSSLSSDCDLVANNKEDNKVRWKSTA